MAKKRNKKVKKAQKSNPRKEPDLEAVWIALLECFAAVDDVLTEHDAFAPETIHKSLGRIYRQWLDSREALDPDFDRQKYRHDMKAKTKERTARSPLGRELPASGSQTSSTGRTSISEKSTRRSAAQEKLRVKTSASRARSDRSASTGRSNTKNPSASGAASRSAKGKGSGSGLNARATPRSRKAMR